jgi:hypothetical protein
MVVFHFYFFGIHHRYPGPVITESIAEVGVIIGEHEVKAIPDIFFTQVVTDT